MPSSYDFHPLCECGSFFTITLQTYEKRLLCRQVGRPNITSGKLEIRAIAALVRSEKYSGQLHKGIT